jgi:KipI family sensor histidine kinase inhibitor
MRLTIREVGEGALLVEFPGVSEDVANRAAVAAAGRLGRPGLLDAIPGARSLFLVYDARLDRRALERDLEGAADPSAGSPGRTVRVPVRYGGRDALDLPDLARNAGISAVEFVRRHAAAAYRVAFLGFAPGFAYCVGLPDELAAPRLATPRTRVPAGGVAIGGSYTGVYPARTPGGWRLIGRTGRRLFDPASDPPTLFLPGDSVIFEPTDNEPPPSGDPPSPRLRRTGHSEIAAGSADWGTPIFRVSNPGLFTSLQGAPRHGRGAFGVPAGGAMDLAALSAGNALVGNSAGSAALELTLAGPELEVLADGRAAIAGASMAAELNGLAVAPGRPFHLRRGGRLRTIRATSGVRAYLCVAGGLAIPPAEWQTRPLLRDDVVCRAEAPAPVLASVPSGHVFAEGIVRVVLGPQEDRFDERGIAAFLSQTWRVSASSDRRGVRLEGEPVPHAGSAEIAPEGTALGAIQVPPDGRPIVLGPDRPVTGGYAKIATVLTADWPLIAQAAPGAILRFRAVGTLRE